MSLLDNGVALTAVWLTALTGAKALLAYGSAAYRPSWSKEAVTITGVVSTYQPSKRKVWIDMPSGEFVGLESRTVFSKGVRPGVKVSVTGKTYVTPRGAKTVKVEKLEIVRGGQGS